jgi:hypothetical protein
MDPAFLVTLLTACSFSGFNCLLSALISLEMKRKAKDFFPGAAFASNMHFYSI